MKNRLQFVHCDIPFKTSAEAREYVENGDLISYSRPALFAEPMVLKYGDEKNPNILLAIGSVGDGKTPTKDNKVFFIDFASIESSIDEIKEQISNGNIDLGEVKEHISQIIESCGFNADGEYVPNQEDAHINTATSLNEADKLLSKALDDNYKELMEQISKLDNFSVSDSNTIAHKLVKGESGSTLTSNVKLSELRTVGNVNFDNILIEQADGIYANVRLDYDGVENKLIFGVNDETKEFALPKENHIIGGKYDTKTESLILTFKEPLDGDSNELTVDLSKLIGEWTVLGENTDTPVILTKLPVKSDDVLHDAESYQDVLKADVRIPSAEYKPYNILRKTEDNRYLYVDGIADNIKYLKNGQVITVKQALDEVDCNVSVHEGNIIYRKEDGIFADVNLEYIKSRNVLKFTKTNKDGDIDVEELELNNITFLENIYYDSLTEEIVIQYKDANGEIKDIRIPVSSIFEEWVVDNTNHTVTLTKSDHQTAGKDTLSADVNIASTSDNILRVVNHGLHVKGTSDNIKHDGSTVKDALDLLNGAEDVEGSTRNLIKKESDERKAADESIIIQVSANETAISENKSALDNEINRASLEEKRIEDKLDTALTKQGTVNTQITSAIEKIEGDLSSEITRSTEKDAKLENDLNGEIIRAKAEEQRIENSLSAMKESLNAKDDELLASITSLDNKLLSEQDARVSGDTALDEKILAESERAKEAENTISRNLTCTVENTDNITLTKTSNTPDDGYKLSGRVNISSVSGNIINQNGALFASVDIQYNSAKNILTLVTSNNASKDIQLSVGSIIKSITYDSENKQLVIVYINNEEGEQTIYVPVSDLYNEWVVEDRDDSVIKLTKVKGEAGEPDVLKADLKLATPESGNLLQNTKGNLYASNKALDIKLSDHVGTNVEAAIVDLNGRVVELEKNSGDTINVEDTSTVDLTINKEGNTHTIKADVKVSLEENNLVEIKDDGLFVLEDYDFGTY